MAAPCADRPCRGQGAGKTARPLPRGHSQTAGRGGRGRRRQALPRACGNRRRETGRKRPGNGARHILAGPREMTAQQTGAGERDAARDVRPSQPGHGADAGADGGGLPARALPAVGLGGKRLAEPRLPASRPGLASAPQGGGERRTALSSRHDARPRRGGLCRGDGRSARSSASCWAAIAAPISSSVPGSILFLNIPALVIIVLAYIWFGLNEAAAIGAVAVNKIPNVVVTMREGARALDPRYAEMATVYRFGALDRIRHILLPQLQPYLAAASRSGIALIWKIVLVVELARPLERRRLPDLSLFPALRRCRHPRLHTGLRGDHARHRTSPGAAL